MSIKRHTYDYSIDIKSGSAPARVVRMVDSGHRVLELGCGPGSITRHLKAKGCSVTALELDSAAIEQARPYCESIHRADFDRDDWPEFIGRNRRFDIVLAADVLEHLRDPAGTLRRMASFVSDAGAVVLSLPHVGHSAIHACLYRGNFEYREWGLLDRTHIRFFGIHNMQTLVEECGLKIVRAEFVIVPPFRTEFARAWRSLPPALRRELRKSTHGNIYQVVLKAVPGDAPGTGVSLEDLVNAVKSRRKESLIERAAAVFSAWR